MAHLKSIFSDENRSLMFTLNLADYPHIPSSDLFKLVKRLPTLTNKGPWIAGGSVWRTVSNEPLNNCDVDVFFSCKEQYEEMCRKMGSYPYIRNVLNEKRGKWNTVYKVHVSEKDYNKAFEVQFVGMNYSSKLEKLLEKFDFSVCQFGFDGKNIIHGETSLNDLTKRILNVYRIDHPKTFLKHMRKYLEYGFTLPSDQLKKVVKDILNFDVWKSTNASKGYDEVDTLKMEKDEDINSNPYIYRAPRAVVAEEPAPTEFQPMNLPAGTVFYNQYVTTTPQWFTTPVEATGWTTIAEQTAVNRTTAETTGQPMITAQQAIEANSTVEQPVVGLQEAIQRAENIIRAADRPMTIILDTEATIQARPERDAEDEWEGYGYGYTPARREEPIDDQLRNADRLRDAIQEARAQRVTRIANTRGERNNDDAGDWEGFGYAARVGRNIFGRTELEQIEYDRQNNQRNDQVQEERR